MVVCRWVGVSRHPPTNDHSTGGLGVLGEGRDATGVARYAAFRRPSVSPTRSAKAPRESVGLNPVTSAMRLRR